MTQREQNETIHQIQNVPSGVIFKGIGAVLAAHAERIETLERKNIADRWREVTGRCQLVHASPLNVGKFRKFCAACGWLKLFCTNFLRKK